jgi:hypothetical protein
MGNSTEALLLATKGTGLQVNTNKTKLACMFMSRHHNTEQNHKR